MRRLLLLLCCALGLSWMHCQAPAPEPLSKDGIKRMLGATLSTVQALVLVEGPSLPTGGLPAAEVTAKGTLAYAKDEATGSGDATAAQRFTLDGNATRSVTKHAATSQQTTPLTAQTSRFGQQRRAQSVKVPCPKKRGDTWVLEGAYALDRDKSREGTATLLISPSGVKAEVTYDDGTKETVDIELDKHSSFRNPNYADLFKQVFTSDVSELTDAAIQDAEANNNYNVANTRIVSQTTLYSKSEGKDGQVLKEVADSSNLIFAKSNEYNTARNATEHPGDPKGRFSSLSVLLSKASLKGRGLSFFYTYTNTKDDCPKEPGDGSDGSTASDGGSNESSPEPTPPEVDCKQYQAGGTAPSWYVGTKKDSKLCQAMYDKLYGQNGNDILCKTDADCKNPCRYLCCGDALRLEQIICKDGVCTLGVTDKCNFCATGEGGDSCTLPDEFKTP